MSGVTGIIFQIFNKFITLCSIYIHIQMFTKWRLQRQKQKHQFSGSCCCHFKWDQSASHFCWKIADEKQNWILILFILFLWWKAFGCLIWLLFSLLEYRIASFATQYILECPTKDFIFKFSPLSRCKCRKTSLICFHLINVETNKKKLGQISVFCFAIAEVFFLWQIGLLSHLLNFVAQFSLCTNKSRFFPACIQIFRGEWVKH